MVWAAPRTHPVWEAEKERAAQSLPRDFPGLWLADFSAWGIAGNYSGFLIIL